MSDDPEPDPPWLAEARQMHGLAPLQPEDRETHADASDFDAAVAARRKQRLAERAYLNTLHEMMLVADVRAVLYRWLAAAGAFRAHDFPPGAPMDALQLARNAAHREWVQSITNDLLRCAPDQYVTMLKENAPD